MILNTDNTFTNPIFITLLAASIVVVLVIAYLIVTAIVQSIGFLKQIKKVVIPAVNEVIENAKNTNSDATSNLSLTLSSKAIRSICETASLSTVSQAKVYENKFTEITNVYLNNYVKEPDFNICANVEIYNTRIKVFVTIARKK